MTYPTPPPAPYGPPPAGPWAPPPRPNSGLAIAALVLGLVGLAVSWVTFGIPSLLALIFGIIGIRQTGSGPGKRSGRGMAVTGTVLGGVILALGVWVSAVFVYSIGAAGTAAANAIANAPAASLPTDASAPTFPADETTTPPPPTLSPSDFRVTLKTTSKQCYGDGVGCTIEYRADLTYLRGPTPPEGTYDITFDVRGGDDGAITDTIELSDGQYTPAENVATTPSSGTKLTVVVTAVDSLN